MKNKDTVLIKTVEDTLKTQIEGLRKKDVIEDGTEVFDTHVSKHILLLDVEYNQALDDVIKLLK